MELHIVMAAIGSFVSQDQLKGASGSDTTLVIQLAKGVEERGRGEGGRGERLGSA